MSPQKRSVGIVILLSILTCGIYYLYWTYSITNDVNEYLQDNDTSGGMVLLFSIITCGIYSIYWYYKMGKRISYCQEKAQIRVSDDSVLLLILSIFQLHIVGAAIVQSNLNKL